MNCSITALLSLTLVEEGAVATKEPFAGAHGKPLANAGQTQPV